MPPEGGTTRAPFTTLAPKTGRATSSSASPQPDPQEEVKSDGEPWGQADVWH